MKTKKLHREQTICVVYRCFQNAWAGVLTQPYTKEMGGRLVTVHHLVTYMSGLFRGSQLNWSALTKETYAIYMSVKKTQFLPYRCGNYAKEWPFATQEIPVEEYIKQ